MTKVQHTEEKIPMRSHRTVNAAITGCIILFLYLIIVPAVQAGIFYDAAIKGTYEDNVVGLLSDKRGGTAGMSATTGPGTTMMAIGVMGPGMGGNIPQDTGVQSKSDTSINVFADIGVLTEIASGASAFLMGSAQHTFYSSFTEFDSTIGGLSAGVNEKLGDIVSARLAISGGIKRYNDSVRDSSAYSPAVFFKEQFTPSFWLKESYYYEKNNADSALFSYKGNAVGIWSGYLVLPKTTLLLGYDYLVRDYDQPSGFEVTANTISVGLGHELAKNWFFDAQYAHQISDSNVAGTKTTDNIISVGLRYSY
jgi:hypothetical protein